MENKYDNYFNNKNLDNHSKAILEKLKENELDLLKRFFDRMGDKIANFNKIFIIVENYQSFLELRTVLSYLEIYIINEKKLLDDSFNVQDFLLNYSNFSTALKEKQSKKSNKQESTVSGKKANDFFDNKKFNTLSQKILETLPKDEQNFLIDFFKKNEKIKDYNIIFTIVEGYQNLEDIRSILTYLGNKYIDKARYRTIDEHFDLDAFFQNYLVNLEDRLKEKQKDISNNEQSSVTDLNHNPNIIKLRIKLINDRDIRSDLLAKINDPKVTKDELFFKKIEMIVMCRGKPGMRNFYTTIFQDNSINGQFIDKFGVHVLNNVKQNYLALLGNLAENIENGRKSRWTKGTKDSPKVLSLKKIKNFLSGKNEDWFVDNEKKLYTLVKSICNTHRNNFLICHFGHPASLNEFNATINKYPSHYGLAKDEIKNLPALELSSNFFENFNIQEELDKISIPSEVNQNNFTP